MFCSALQCYFGVKFFWNNSFAYPVFELIDQTKMLGYSLPKTFTICLLLSYIYLHHHRKQNIDKTQQSIASNTYTFLPLRFI